MQKIKNATNLECETKKIKKNIKKDLDILKSACYYILMTEQKLREIYEECGFNTTDFINKLEELGCEGVCSEDKSLATYSFEEFSLLTGSSVGFKITSFKEVWDFAVEQQAEYRRKTKTFKYIELTKDYVNHCGHTFKKGEVLVRDDGTGQYERPNTRWGGGCVGSIEHLDEDGYEELINKKDLGFA